MTGLPSTEPSRRPLRRDAEANRQRVLTAAGQVFAEHGLAASVDAVIEAAGVGPGTFYRRFPDKDALITELVTDLVDRLTSLARAALAERPHGTGLEWFLRAAGHEMQAHHGLLPRVWRDEPRREQVALVRGLLGELLRDAQQHGVVSAALDPADVSVALWALTGVIETSAGVDPDVWRRHLDVVLAGMRTSGLQPSRPATTPEQLTAITCRRAGENRVDPRN